VKDTRPTALAVLTHIRGCKNPNHTAHLAIISVDMRLVLPSINLVYLALGSGFYADELPFLESINQRGYLPEVMKALSERQWPNTES